MERATASREAGHLLSFDVEEYFQVEAAAAAGLSRDDWSGYPSRVAECVDRILQVLDEHGASATFFVLGWIARRHGDLVRRIAGAGHEIASHGMNHAMIGRLTARQFREDLLDSRALLEDLSGHSVLGYRAPTFSMTHATAWALDVLAEAGFRYDSSVFPVRHDRYGVPEAPRRVHRAVGPGGGSIVEVPLLTLRCVGLNLPVAGGGYLRLLPIRLIGRALRAFQRRGWAGMIYLHPWEIDPDQPALPMGRFARWRHRVGLARTETKLRWLLRRFRFTQAGKYVQALEPDELEDFRYGCRP